MIKVGRINRGEGSGKKESRSGKREEGIEELGAGRRNRGVGSGKNESRSGEREEGIEEFRPPDHPRRSLPRDISLTMPHAIFCL